MLPNLLATNKGRLTAFFFLYVTAETLSRGGFAERLVVETGPFARFTPFVVVMVCNVPFPLGGEGQPSSGAPQAG